MKWTDQDIDLALRDLAGDDPPEAALAAVRARVLAGLAEPRRRPWLWWIPAPALAAAALVVWFAWPRPADVPPPPVLARAPQAQLADARGSVTARPTRRPTEPRPKGAVASLVPVQNTEFAKLLTDDPDVVILWAVGPNGTDSEGVER
jgi:hypothetical protein